MLPPACIQRTFLLLQNFQVVHFCFQNVSLNGFLKKKEKGKEFSLMFHRCVHESSAVEAGTIHIHWFIEEESE